MSNDDQDAATAATPWYPESLRQAVTREQLRAEFRYVVLEEIVDGLAVLHDWPWPVVDPLGRLFWPGEEEQDGNDVAVPVAVLHAQLYAPNGLEREPRCGDTFAAQPARRRRSSGGRPDLRALFRSPLYDVSADAREAAKLAYQGGVAAVQNELLDVDGTDLLAAAAQARPHDPAPQLEIAAPLGADGAPRR